MRIHVTDMATGQGLEGLVVVVGRPIDRAPTPAALQTIPATRRGVTGPEGGVELTLDRLSRRREVQVMVLQRQGDDTLRILHTQSFADRDTLPEELTIEVRREAQPIADRPRPGTDGPLGDRPRPFPPTDPDQSGGNDLPRPHMLDDRRPLPGGGRASFTRMGTAPLGQKLAREGSTGAAVADTLRKGGEDALRRDLEALQEGGKLADAVLSQVPLGAGKAHVLRPGQNREEQFKKSRDAGLKTLKRRAEDRRGMLMRGQTANALKNRTTLTAKALEKLIGAAGFSGRVKRATAPKHLVQHTNPQGLMGTPEAPVAPPTPPDNTSTEDVLRQIAQRVAQLEQGQRANADDIRQNLDTKLAVGPADQPAFYDVPVLHVAWKDTWEAAFDDMTRQEIAELYRSIVEVVPPGYVSPGPNAEVRELKDLLNDLSGVVTSAQSALAAPSDLISWLPKLKNVWSLLSPLEQDKMRFFYHVHYFCADNFYYPGSELIFRNYETRSGKEAAIEKFYYAFWKSYTTTQAANNQHHTDALTAYRSGENSYDYGTRVNDTSGKLQVAFVRYFLRSKDKLADFPDEFGQYNPDWLFPESINKIYQAGLAETRALEIIDGYDPTGTNTTSTSPLGRAENLIRSLQLRAEQPYQFDVFAKDSYNFGLITTFRQKWEPLAYQAGDLAATLPLAPNETRSFSVTRKQNLTEKRSDSSTSYNQRSQSLDDVTRAEGEIFRRTSNALNAGADFSSAFKGGFLGNGGELRFGGGVSSDMGNESSQTKTELREVTRKMAQEYRDERKVEVTTEATSSLETIETREITNPNNEITVTYLFYELQRQFRVSERLHDVTPVVLVAFAVPKPSAINEAWLLKHGWILREVLMDAEMLPVLDQLSRDFAGDEVAVEILETQWKTQLSVVADLRMQMKAHTGMRDQARAALEDALGEVIDLPDDDTRKKEVGSKLAEELFGANDDSEAARQALDWAEMDLTDAEAALTEGISALERATQRYVAAVKERLNRRTRIDQLILHVKSNILYYMQEIWRREPTDQRYLRLYDIKVAWSDTVQIERIEPTSAGALQSVLPEPGLQATSAGKALAQAKGVNEVALGLVDLDDTVELHEIADLSTILGFRGNYAAFRLKYPNALSAYLLQSFLDSHFGLFDPDPDGELPTAEEAIELAQEAWKNPATSEQDKARIAQWLVDALEAAHRVSQVIAVPSGELFIEALPGTHAVLEDFKLQHRAIDAAKAEVDVRLAEAELQRRIARLNAGDLSDPDVDKTLRIDGAPAQVTVDPEA